MTPAEVLLAMVAAFDGGDLGSVAEIVHPDYLDHQGLDGQRPISGIEGFVHVVRTARSAYAELSVEVVDLIEGADRAAGRIVWDGVRASGEQVRRETIDIVRVSGGRAIEHWGGVS
jgi:predicted ester cyclase